MTNKMLKLTPVALSIFTAFQVNAALYQVVKVGTPDWIANNYTANATIGSAIQDSTDDGDSATNFNSCFIASSIGGTSCSAFLLAGETRLAGTDETIGTVAGAPIDGVSFREEAPFGIDNAFSYIQSQSDFEDYCDAQLMYSTCNSWAAKHWAMWSRELSGSTIPNAIAFLENSSSSSYDYGISSSSIDLLTVNTVVNQVTSNGALVGTSSSLGDSRTTVTAVAPIEATTSKTRAWKTDGTYTIGSVATDYSNYYGDYYSSKAAIWTSGNTPVQISWQDSITQAVDYKIPQGSMRDFVVVGGVIYGVGFNTWNSSYNFMNATVFKVDESNVNTSSNWSSILVSNVQATSSSKVYGNSVLTGINSNLVAIGEAKRIGTAPASGSAANRPFLIADVSASDSSLSATFFADQISFAEAGGKAMAINNYNEIVGQIDVDTTREVNGKPRRKRGYIYPYNGNGTSTARREIFNNQAWLLDDLTNGGTYSSDNNAFRIISANDINDAGVIAATAIYCEGGYDSTAYDAQCGEGSGTETTVAVKLVPIAGATSSNIVQRSYETSTSTRQGAAVGYGLIAFLGLILFGRRRKSLSIS